MSIKKFGENDLLINTMKTHPKSEFFIFDGTTYYNNRNLQSGAYSHNVRNVGPGHISLYEYNIDKGTGSYGSRLTTGGGVNPFIFPFVVKSSDRAMFRTSFTGSSADADSFWGSLEDGTQIYGNYPMSASISRQFWTGSSDSSEGGKCGKYAAQKYNHTNSSGDEVYRDEYRNYSPGGIELVECASGPPVHRHYYAIRNKLQFYRARSEHYAVSSSLLVVAPSGSGPATSDVGSGLASLTSAGWNKDLQEINAIMIPSIFFGSEIKPGSLSLKMYVTGTLIGELQDTKRNGELIQVSGALSDWGRGSGSVAGVALYDEGVLLLTGNWPLGAEQQSLRIHSTPTDYPKWKYFGAGCEDKITTATVGASFVSMSFDLSFKGTTETQILTMYTHAKKGRVNNSNNPTFIKFGQDKLSLTSSTVYQENDERLIKNTVSSSFTGHSASFERQVYISKIGIYDKKKRLIGIASLANPVLKKEDQDYTFKLKLDI